VFAGFTVGKKKERKKERKKEKPHTHTHKRADEMQEESKMAVVLPTYYVSCKGSC
jgi:hypothetical protein